MRIVHSNWIHRKEKSSGAALVIILIFIAMLTIMVVSFLDTSRLDHNQATSHRERTRAALFANEGVEKTLATLQLETTEPPLKKEGETAEQYAQRVRFWITQPGALIVPEKEASNPKLLQRRVELSSGIADLQEDVSSVFQPARLNIPLLNQQKPPGHLITERVETVDGIEAVPGMPLKWIYLRSDRSEGDYFEDVEQQPDLTDNDRPIIGRYAYWVDDESTKLNYNLAWKKTPQGSTTINSNPESHPSNVNLMALSRLNQEASDSYLPEIMADALRNASSGSNGRFFNSFADARQLQHEYPGISEFLSENKFELTHYNHDPDTTFFGEERIMLTMNKELAAKRDAAGNIVGYYKFLDILRDDIPRSKKDPGFYDHIAGGQSDYVTTPQNGHPNKFDAVVRDLMRYLSTDNWPMAPGKSYKTKFFSSSSDHIAQLAVNIIEYVRAKESQKQFIAPLRYQITNGKYTLGIGSGGYQGISRAPYLYEMGYWMESEPAPLPDPLPSNWPRTNGVPDKLYRGVFKHEFYLPKNYGITEPVNIVPDLSEFPTTGENGSKGWFLGLSAMWTNDFYFLYPFPNPQTGARTLTLMNGADATRIYAHEVSGRTKDGRLANGGDGGTWLHPGNVVVVTKEFYRTKSPLGKPTENVRAGIYIDHSSSNGAGGNRYAQTGVIHNMGRAERFNVVPQGGGSVFYGFRTSAQGTVDQMLSLEVDDPRANVSGKDWKPNPNGGNSFGRLNDRSTVGKPMDLGYVPQQDSDAQGRVSDHSLFMPPPKGKAGNLEGRVTSVAELGYIHTGNNSAGVSVPWRTLRLQPSNLPNATIQLPDWLLLDLFTVPNTGASGSQNMYKPNGSSVGGRVNVNSQVMPFTDMTRNRALVALFLGAAGVHSTAQAEEIAYNIYHKVPSPRAKSLHRSFGKVYGYPWTQTPSPEKPNLYDTPMEICEIKGVADDGESGEDRVRSVASLITARTGVFSVYTIGQSLKQSRSGVLSVTAEQRQHAMVERVVDPVTKATRFQTVYFRNLSP